MYHKIIPEWNVSFAPEGFVLQESFGQWWRQRWSGCYVQKDAFVHLGHVLHQSVNLDPLSQQLGCPEKNLKITFYEKEELLINNIYRPNQCLHQQQLELQPKIDLEKHIPHNKPFQKYFPCQLYPFNELKFLDYAYWNTSESEASSGTSNGLPSDTSLKNLINDLLMPSRVIESWVLKKVLKLINVM